MTRMKRDSRLENREARSKLPAQQEPYWRKLIPGVALGYYRGANGSAWFVRRFEAGRYQKRRLGLADDHAKADGKTVLSYAQAHTLALDKKEGLPKAQAQGSASYTVAEAIADYLRWFAEHRRSLDSTRLRCEVDILPALGSLPVRSLTVDGIESWLQEMARTSSADPEAKRKRRATANRTLTVLRAALNRAYRRGLVESDHAWRRVSPFRNVDAAVIRYLTVDEARRLINACPPDFRQLVQAALFTGMRYGELRALKCSDYNPDSGTVLVRHSKTGKGRHVALTDEGRALFDELTAGRDPTEIMLLRKEGDSFEPWGISHQHRRMKDACTHAKIEPAVSFHILRHTYGSLLARAGTPMAVIARGLGHSDSRMSEKHYAHLQPDYVSETIRRNLPRFSQSRKPAKVRRIR